MANTTFTILGMTGSGKTCYLLGMFYKMSAGIKGYTITTDEDSEVELRNWYKRLADNSLGNDRFPAGTDSLSKYEFNLEYAYKKILSFSWMDYPGNMLDLKSTGNVEDYNQVKESILNSSCLFICIDGELLKGNDSEEKINKIRDNCSGYLNPFFSELNNKHKLPPIAIVITKYDLCNDDVKKEEDLIEIIEEAFSSLFLDDGEHKKIVTIIPVSIGNNINNESYHEKLKPLNIQLPIFMGIIFALKNELKKLYKNKLNYNNNYDDKIKSIQNEIDDEKWWWECLQDKDKIRSLEENLEQIKEIKYIEMKERDRLNNLIQSVKNSQERLLKELDKIPYIFVNGEKRESFSSVIKGE